MFIVAQRVGGTVHKRTHVSFTNTKLLGVSEEVVLFKSFSSRWLSHNCFSNITNCDSMNGAGFEDFTSFSLFLIMIFLS